MSENVLSFVFEGKDKVSETAEKIRGHFEVLEGGIGKFAKSSAIALGTTAVGAVVGFGLAIKEGISAASNYEDILGQMRAELKATGGQAHVSVEDMKKLAEGLSDLSGQQDEVIMSGENLLLSFRNVRNEAGKGNQIFSRATSDALDLSTAFHEDLNLAIRQVGSALNDPVNGFRLLRRVGITFTDSQKEQIKTLEKSGHTLEAQKIILGELEKRFGGVAKAAGSTFSGSLDKLHNAIDDTFRDLAAVFVPILGDVASWFAERLPKALRSFTDLMGGLAKIVEDDVLPPFRHLGSVIEENLPHIDWKKVLGKAQDVIAASRQITKGWATAAGNWASVIITSIRTGFQKGDWKPLGRTLGKTLASAIQNSIKGTADLTRALMTWIQSVDWMTLGKGAVRAAVPFAIGFVNDLVSALIETAVKHPMDMVMFVATFLPVTKLLAGFKPVMEFLEHIPILGSLATAIIKGGARVFDALLSVTKRIGGWIWEGIVHEFPALENAGHSLWIHFSTPIGVRILDALKWGQSIPRFIFTGIGKGIAWVIRGMAWVIDKLISPFVGIDRWLVSKGIRLLEGLGRGIGSWVGRIASLIGRFISDRLLAPFRSAGSWLYGRGRDVIAGLWRGFNNWIGNVRSGIGSFISNRIIGPFRGARNWLIGHGRNIISGLWSGMRQAIGSAFSWVRDHIFNPIKNAIVSLFHISSPSKVMMGLGGHVISGFIAGLLRHDPLDVITHIAGSAIKALSDMVTGGIIDVGRLSVDLLNKLPGFQGTMPISGGGNVANMQTGQRMAALLGWTGNQWAALAALWNRESGWNQYARNSSSGAYGIPQSLPASKMASAGGDWMTNPATQIRWGLGYIAQRYGNPGNAWAHEAAYGWYDRGGLARGAGLFAKGPQPERILSPRQTLWFERAMSAVAHGGGTGGVTVQLIVQAPHYVGDKSDLVMALGQLSRQGRLDDAVRRAVGAR